MSSSKAILVVLLWIGTAIAFETITFGTRVPGDRPFYVNTVQSDETQQMDDHYVLYEWFGYNEKFTFVYVEASSWAWASLTQPGAADPLYGRHFELEVGTYDTTQLTVSFIVFGFVDQPVIQSTSYAAALLQQAESKVVEHKVNKV